MSSNGSRRAGSSSCTTPPSPSSATLSGRVSSRCAAIRHSSSPSRSEASATAEPPIVTEREANVPQP